jgi:hypothetical protein
MAISELSRKLLEVLTSKSGLWMKRSEIARGLNKARLNQYEIAALDFMASQGLIDYRKQNNQTPIGYHWEYRAHNVEVNETLNG